MLDCIKTSFNLTNKYIILATPLILFSLLSSLYVLFSVGGNFISLLFAVVLFTLMFGAFISGWFYMITKCIKNPDIDDPNALIKDFPSGVGEYFLSALGLILISFILAVVVLAISYLLGMKFIGDIGIQPEAFSKAMETTSALKSFLMSLSEEQLMKLNAWNILLFASMSITYFLIMFYSPVMFFKEKNPLKALWISLKDLLCRNFLKNAFLFILISLSYTVLSVFTTIAGTNVVTHFLFTLINFYYLIYVAVLVYYYYFSHYIECGKFIDEAV